MGLLRRALRAGVLVATAYIAYTLVAVVLHWIIRLVGDDANGGRVYSIRPVEEFVFRGLPSNWLQDWLGTTNPFLVEASFELWFSLFWATPVLAIVALWLGGPRAFWHLLAVHAVLVYSADIIYALAPTRPVWMDADVTRMIAIETSNAVAFDTNALASLPSLHVAVPTAYAIWFWRQEDARMKRLGPFLALWAAGVAWAVIYTGEHYVLCAIEGALMAVAANLLVEKIHWRGMRPFARRASPEPPPHIEVSPHFAPAPVPLGAGGR